MPKDHIILKLEGNVSVMDFRVALDAFTQLLVTLTAEISPDAMVDWVVADLRGGSAMIDSRGFSDTAEAQATVAAVVDRYEEVAQSAHAGRLDRFSEPVREAMHLLTSIVNGRVPRILMWTGDEAHAWAVASRLTEATEAVEGGDEDISIRPYTRTAIKGRVVTLDQKHGIYFTLEEAYTGRNIRCYPDAKRKEHLGKYWAEGTWVIVEGTFMRYGRSPTLTAITDISPLPVGEIGGWRKAIGSAPRNANVSNISPCDAVRKVRDGQA